MSGQLRIIGLEASNIKRIRTVAIAPTSNVVRIHGENGSGKTSTLDSILWALSGARSVDMVPIRAGEERGVIVLTLGSGETVEYIVTRSFRLNPDESDGKYTTKLTVESAAGALYPKAQAKLDELFGSLSLDPLEFLHMKPADRVDTLKRIVKLEVDVDELDRINAGDFEKRSQVNVEIKALKSRVELYAGGIDDRDVTPIDTKPFLDRMEEASSHNAAIEREKARRESAAKAIEQWRSAAAEKRKQAERLVLEAMDLEKLSDEREFDLKKADALAEPIDVTDVRRQLQDAEKENTTRNLQAVRRDNLETAKKELAAAVARADKFTEQMEYRTGKKAAALAAAKFPVPGLSFGEQGVLFNGFPFDQASGAEQLRVSFAIAASMKPKLPVVLIKDGSLLSDTQGMPLLEELAAEYGAQVWIERVGPGNVGIVLEEGEVVAVDGVPVQTKHAAAGYDDAMARSHGEPD